MTCDKPTRPSPPHKSILSVLTTLFLQITTTTPFLHYSSSNRFIFTPHVLLPTTTTLRKPPIPLSSSFTDLSQETLSILPTRTYKRFRHLIQLTLNHTHHHHDTIADVGCDHGLLSIALASYGYNVIGIDVSKKALGNGALVNYQTVLSNKKEDVVLPVEFRWGDGLNCLTNENEQVSGVCIAGMGVTTILDILFRTRDYSRNNGSLVSPVDRVGCRYLFVQPTNSRPRNLIQLYDVLQDRCWRLGEECIEQIDGRWYISAFFEKVDEDKEKFVKKNFPGHKLVSLSCQDEMYRVYHDYVMHHKNWLQRDLAKNVTLAEEDVRWLHSDVSNL